jgi:hypothetical protein
MPRWLLSIIVLIWLGAGIPVHRVGAAGLAITAFYTTDQTGYGYWQSTGRPPPPIALFQPGTTRVYYYIAYMGATLAQVDVQVRIRDAAGRTADGNVIPLLVEAGSTMGSFSDPIAFAPGLYHYDLRLIEQPSGALMLSGSPLASGTIVATAQFGVAPGLAILSFYTISVSAFRSSITARSYEAYPRVATYPAPTTDIPVFFTYAGAIPHRTSWQVVVHNAAGAIVLRYPRRPYPVSYVAGWQTADLHYVPAWPAGSYHLDLVVDGVPRRRTTIAVRRAHP